MNSATLKKGGFGLALGVLVGELAAPAVYKIAKYLPRKARQAVYRLSPTHHSKSMGVSAISMGIITGNPLMVGAGAGLVVSDAVRIATKDRRMLKEANRAIKGMPALSLTRWEIPDWLPTILQYKMVGDKLRQIITEDTYNSARNCWVHAGREHPAVIALGRRLITENGLDGHDKMSVLQAIQSHIQNNIHYCFDSRWLDLFTHPYIVILQSSGDCDCQAMLAASLGEALGIPMRLKLISQHADSPNRFNHIYSMGECSPGVWTACETIFKVPLGWEPPQVNSMIIDLD